MTRSNSSSKGRAMGVDHNIAINMGMGAIKPTVVEWEADQANMPVVMNTRMRT